MTVNRTTLLDLPLPVTGTESGTWGDTTNNGLTQYLDIAIAGTLVLSTDADVTLTSTEGDSSATNIGATTAQYAILRWTATGSTTRNITALAQSKTYVVINATGGTQSIVLRGAGPTTGVTIISGEKAHCVWNGSDFVKVSSSAAAGGSNTQVQYNSSGVLAGSSNLTFDGTSLTLGGNPTLSAGTANGVLYLNGSKVATSGSALTFDGTTLTTTTTSGIPLVVTGTGSVGARIVGGSGAGAGSYLSLQAQGGNAALIGTEATILGSGTSANLMLYGYGSNSIVFAPATAEQMRLTSTGLLLGLSSALDNGKLQIAGGIGLSGNTQIRQATNGDGNTLQVFATQFVAGSLNSTSYSYAGGGLIASVSPGDSAVLLDTGRATSTDGRFKVLNTTSANTALSLEKNGVYTLYADTGSGNLGIGTSSPGYKLDVVQDQNAATYVRSRNNDAGSSAYAGVVVNAFGNSWAMRMGSSAANSNALQIVQDALGTPSVRATFDTSGNLGLGVTPSAWASGRKAFQFNNVGALWQQSNGYINLAYNTYEDGANTFKYIVTDGAARFGVINGAFAWFNAPSGTAGNAITFTQAMTLDASGNLGVGETSPALRLHVKSASAAIGYFETSDTGTGPYVIWRNGTTSIGDVGSGKGISGSGNATDFMIASRSTYPLLFGTGGSERARITSGGDLLVGTTSTAAKLTVEQSGFNANGASITNQSYNYQTLGLHNTATANDNLWVTFGTEASFTTRGNIDYNRAGGLTRYNTTSDYRAKDIIGPVQNTGAIIDALKVYEGKMKGATQARPMMVAHEAQAVVPFCVSGVKDETNEDGTPKYQQMDHASLVPLLLAEIQSLRQRVALLEGN